MDIERKLAKMGIDLPDFGGDPYHWYGTPFGKMKQYHRNGNLIFLAGHTPVLPDGSILHPGRVGAEVTLEQGQEAARLTGIYCLAGIKQAVGDLDRVTGIVRTMNFVTCAPGFSQPGKVTDGLTDLFAEVYGPKRGVGGRATMGVMVLASNICFESVMTVEVA